MKRILVWLLVASLGVNAVLLARRLSDDTAESPGGISPDPSAAVSHPASEKSRPAAAAAVDSVPGTSATERDLWRALQSTDLATLVANLRAAGFSEDDAQAVAWAVLMDRNTARRAAFREANGPVPYWKSTRGDGLTPEQRAEMRALFREADMTMLELFGVSYRSAESRRYFAPMYGPVPAAAVDKLMRIEMDYSDLQQQIMEDRQGGPMMPWDREKLAFLEAEKRQDIEATLTPEEREMLRLYGPGIATSMRRELAGFEPTEAEFRAILDIRSEYETPNSAMTFMDPSAMQQRRAAMTESKEKIKAALGDARFADYERVTDPGYRNASQIAMRLELPETSATAAYQLGRDMQARMAAIDQDRSLPGPDKRAALGALAVEARAQLDSILTPAGASAFSRGGGGWLRALEGRGGVR